MSTVQRDLVGGFLVALAAFASVRSTEAAEVVVAFGAEPVQVDPTRSSAGVDQYFMNLFYEQLLAVTPDLERVNWLAESWSVDQSGPDTVLHVTLRPDVRFHNGDVLTSDDFRYAYERQSDPISRNAGRFRYIRDLVVLDERRFDIVFDTPDGAFIPLNLALFAIPRRYFEEVGDAGVQTHPIGTGPWRFVSRTPREELVVERFEDYWNPAAQPAAERLVIKIIPEDTTRVAAFRTGAVDWIDAVPPALIADFETLPGVRVVSLPAPNNLFLNINVTDANSPLADVRVRRAIAHAVDFDAIIEFILYGQGIRTAQLAPGTLGYDPDLDPYPYDPERARALLAEAGFERGINVNCYNLTTPREPYIKEMGEAVFAYLGTAGIRCRIVQLEYGAWINLARVNARPLMDGILSTMWGQGLPGDPTDAWSGHLHSSGDGWGPYSYHVDPEIDGLVEELRTTLDPDARQRLARELARVKHERVAGGLPTYRPMITFAWRDTLEYRPWPGAFWRSMREIGPARSAEGIR